MLEPAGEELSEEMPDALEAVDADCERVADTVSLGVPAGEPVLSYVVGLADAECEMLASALCEGDGVGETVPPAPS